MVLGPLLYGLVILGFVALLAAAAVSDVRFYRIPNRLCAGVAILFAIFCLVSLFGADNLFRIDWLGGLMVGAAAMAIGAGVFALGLFGGGDVKLIAAIALWAGPQGIGGFLIITTLAGGVVALLILLAHTLERIRNSVNGAGKVVSHEKRKVPYGLAIAAGGLFVAGRLLAVQSFAA